MCMCVCMSVSTQTSIHETHFTPIPLSPPTIKYKKAPFVHQSPLLISQNTSLKCKRNNRFNFINYDPHTHKHTQRHIHTHTQTHTPKHTHTHTRALQYIVKHCYEVITIKIIFMRNAKSPMQYCSQSDLA